MVLGPPAESLLPRRESLYSIQFETGYGLRRLTTSA